MARTIKARFSKGVIKPLEKVEIPEGEEITITITEVPAKPTEDAFERSAGAWRDTVDCDELIKNIYEDRLISTRPQVKL